MSQSWVDLLDSLKSTERIEDVEVEYEKLSKRGDAPELGIKLVHEIFKRLETPAWIESVDATLLCRAVSLFGAQVTSESANCQMYLASVCYIHSYVLKKSSDATAANMLFDCIFNNANVQMTPKYERIYWSALSDFILFAESKKIIDSDVIIERTTKFLEIAERKSLYSDYLYRFIKKFFAMFNDKQPRMLGMIYEKIFRKLMNLENDRKSDDLQAKSLFKTLLPVTVNLLQNTISSGYTSNDAMSHFLSLMFALLEPSDEHVAVISALRETMRLICIESRDIELHHYEYLDKLTDNIATLKRQLDKEDYEEYLLVLRSLMSRCMGQWIKTGDVKWNIAFVKSLYRFMHSIALELRLVKKQYAKCKDCKYESGFHESLHILTLATEFFKSVATNAQECSELIPLAIDIFILQTDCVLKLIEHACCNWNAMWSTIEKGFYNVAILLHRNKQTIHSISLSESYFDCFVRVFEACPEKVNLKNLSKAYSNFGLCCMEVSKFEEAVNYSYISIALTSLADSDRERHQMAMKCISTSKSRALQRVMCSGHSFKDNPDTEIWCECLAAIEDMQKLNIYSQFQNKKPKCGIIEKIVRECDFGKLLVAELETYAKLWYTTFPIIGICEALTDLCKGCSDPQTTMDNALHCGKAITLISLQTSRLHVQSIIDFVNFTGRNLEAYSRRLSKEASTDEVLLAMLYGNCLRASYECDLLERLRKEPPPAQLWTSSTASDPRPDKTPHPDDVCDVAPTHRSLTLRVEEEMIRPLIGAVRAWRDVMVANFDPSELRNKHADYVRMTIEIMEIVLQLFSVRGLEVYALDAADVAYHFADLFNERKTILRTVGFVIEHVFEQTPMIKNKIDKANRIVRDILEADAINAQDLSLMDTVYEYLLNLTIHLYNCGMKEKALRTLVFVHNKIEHDFFLIENPRNIDNIKHSYAKLLSVRTLFVSESNDSCKSVNESIGQLTNSINAIIHSTDVLQSASRMLRDHSASLRMWIDNALLAGRLSLMIGIPRRARAVLRTLLSMLQKLLLPRPTAEVLVLLAFIDFHTEKFEDCRVKLDSVAYIVDEYKDSILVSANNDVQIRRPVEVKRSRKIDSSNDDLKQLEMVLDAPSDRYPSNNLGGSPVFQSPPFAMPSFIDHRKICDCKKCVSFNFYTVIFSINHLRALLEFQTGTSENASSFFDGTLKLLRFLKARTTFMKNERLRNLKNFPCGDVNYSFGKAFGSAETEFYIDAAYYFLAREEDAKAEELNELASSIEVLPELKALLAQRLGLQKVLLRESKIVQTHPLDIDMETVSEALNELTLTPEKAAPQPSMDFKTPVNRANPQMNTRIKLKAKNLNEGFLEDLEFEKPEFKRPPAIKFELDCDDDVEKKKETNENVENVVRTPAPRIRNKKLLLESVSMPKPDRDTRSLRVSKMKLIRSVSPGRLDSYEETTTSKSNSTRKSARGKKEAPSKLR